MRSSNADVGRPAGHGNRHGTDRDGKRIQERRGVAAASGIGVGGGAGALDTALAAYDRGDADATALGKRTCRAVAKVGSVGHGQGETASREGDGKGGWGGGACRWRRSECWGYLAAAAAHHRRHVISVSAEANEAGLPNAKLIDRVWQPEHGRQPGCLLGKRSIPVVQKDIRI